MNFDAQQVTVNEILSVRRQYIIPRNQREFSWEKLQLEEFWDDIIRNIKYDKTSNKLTHSEYFIGTIVLAGQESAGILDIIDGQQRLTVITICLSLISRRLREIGHESFADTIWSTYITTPPMALGEKDPTVKIQKTNGKDYFKLKFQDKKDHSPDVEYEEDEKLNYAGNFLSDKLEKKSLCVVLEKTGKRLSYTNEEYSECLFAIQTMLVNYLKMVKISVGTEDDAYDIFEVLNARGISLSSIDLIKNSVFKECSDTFPIDSARKKWTGIDDKIKEIDSSNRTSLTEYIRSWWLSKYSYVGKDQLYRAYKKITTGDKPATTAEKFLNDIHSNIELYIKIVSPKISDWRQADQRPIYECLNALSLFEVVVARPFILAALRLREEKPRSFKQSQLIDLLKAIEQFHFRFNAICRDRSSGLDSQYSSFAVQLSRCKDAKEIKATIGLVMDMFERKMPSDSIFVEKFCNDLWYTNDKPKHKKIISYIFDKLEMSKRSTYELKHHLVSLEHIGSQSTFDKNYVGKIGNLLPLGFHLNESCKNKSVDDKMTQYKQSDLKNVAEFIASYENKWDSECIEKRSKYLAELALKTI
ncbi:DUF262 domain-containing protein [Aeromonas hydrophila]|uniref:DUF262 domain-containing protein n=1 Tax=Aeromonas hydrophila TaxID=644 RepID=UPI00366F9D82